MVRHDVGDTPLEIDRVNNTIRIQLLKKSNPEDNSKYTVKLNKNDVKKFIKILLDYC